MGQVNRFAAYLSLRKYAARTDSQSEATQFQAADFDLLYEAAVSLSSNLQLADLYEKIVQWGCKLADTNNAFIYVVNKEEEVLELKVGTGAYSVYTGIKRGKAEPSVSSVVWRTGQPLAVDHLADWEGKAKDRPYGWDVVKSVLGIPLYSDYEVTAIVGLGFPVSKREFTLRDMDLLSRFAALASLALCNAQLYGSLQAKMLQEDKASTAKANTIQHMGPYGQELLLATRQSSQPDASNGNAFSDHSLIARDMWQTAQLHLADAYLAATREATAFKLTRDTASFLTERERTVLTLMAAGLSNQEIALQVGVEVSTVKTHINHVFGKLGVKRRVQALIRARELGII